VHDHLKKKRTITRGIKIAEDPKKKAACRKSEVLLRGLRAKLPFSSENSARAVHARMIGAMY
jgi:hypothetical protein